MKKNLVSLYISMVFIAGSLYAQGQSPDASAQNFERTQAQITSTTLEPILDGVLDDDIWQQATLISDFHQTTPVDHGVPTQRTEVYVTYSQNYFYVGARMYETEPSEISARQLIQGQSTGFDDSVGIFLDSFNNSRTGFFFSTNPNGIRNEGVWESASSFNDDWSGIWQVEARIDEEGWVAEFAIPFTTLNFDPETDAWGFNVVRERPSINENMAWSSFNRSTNPSTAGQVSGIRDIRQGLGLDVIPSITVANKEDQVGNTSASRFDPSLDVFYKFTPNLTGALTLNTDFSATEVDDVQVNLTRFSLSFPEKRDFFLQDSEIFSFGDRPRFGGGGPSDADPFYSRRIGLDPRTGQPVDIDVGGKLAGRVGDYSVGMLVVQQGDQIGLDGQGVVIGRLTRNILNESRVGFIFTDGDPNSETDNTVVGSDFFYRNTRFSDTHTLTGDLTYQQTDTEGLDGDDKSYYGSLNLTTQNNGFSYRANYRYVGEDYNPALGFARRKRIEQAGLTVSGRYFLLNDPFIRNITSFGRITRTETLDTKQLQTQSIFWRLLNIQFHRGDQFFIQTNYETEGLERDFQIRPGIVIPAGEYSFASYEFNWNATNRRQFAPDAAYEWGEFYDGRQEQFSYGINWRPDEHLSLELRYRLQNIELPAGEFHVRQISLDANYAFNGRWSWVNILQYVNTSGNLGINSRLRWAPRAGEDFFLVVNYNFDSMAGAFEELNTKDSEIVLKYTRNFRF